MIIFQRNFSGKTIFSGRFEKENMVFRELEKVIFANQIWKNDDDQLRNNTQSYMLDRATIIKGSKFDLILVYYQFCHKKF